MPVREQVGIVAITVVGAAFVAVHLWLGLAAVQAAAPLIGWVAVSVGVSFVLIIHVVGFRRLASRRERENETNRTGLEG